MAGETLARDAVIAFNDMIPGGSAEGEDKHDTRAQQNPDGSLPIRHPTILVVDDEPCVLALVRAILAPQYHLVTATCGHEAVALSFRHRTGDAAAGRCDAWRHARSRGCSDCQAASSRIDPSLHVGVL